MAISWTLVTGGAKGLGSNLCTFLAAQGCPILVHYNSSLDAALNIVEACRRYGVPSEVIQGDFSSLESISAFIRQTLFLYPSIKNLINNVGNYLVKPALATLPEEWNALFQTNLYAPLALCQGFLPSLIHLRGNIINIGIVGINNIQANTHCTAYRTAKMALWMATKSMASELISSSVRVNMVSPGYLESTVDLPGPAVRLPMARTASYEEVSRVVAFLLEEKSSYITGQNIEVGGGVGL